MGSVRLGVDFGGKDSKAAFIRRCTRDMQEAMEAARSHPGLDKDTAKYLLNLSKPPHEKLQSVEAGIMDDELRDTALANLDMHRALIVIATRVRAASSWLFDYEGGKPAALPNVEEAIGRELYAEITAKTYPEHIQRAMDLSAGVCDTIFRQVKAAARINIEGVQEGAENVVAAGAPGNVYSLFPTPR